MVMAEGVRRSEIVTRLLAWLAESRYQWCWLNGDLHLPERIDSDLDMLVGSGEGGDFLRDVAGLDDMLVVQLRHYEARSWAVVVTSRRDRSVTLQLDVSEDVRGGGVIFYRAAELLPYRKHCAGGGYCLPPALEFCQYLFKHAMKSRRLRLDRLQDRVLQRLRQLYRSDPPGCRAEMQRKFDPLTVMQVSRCFDTHDDNAFPPLRSVAGRLRRDFVRHSPWTVATYYRQEWRRLAGRVRRCNGVFVVIMGCDGAGKSRVIAGLQETLPGVVTGVRSRHFRFHRRHRGDAAAVTRPHGRPPRPVWLTNLKLLAWWGNYWLGYWLHVRPATCRGEAFFFDRYGFDAFVDPRRYRIGRLTAFQRRVLMTIPRPDAVIVLDVDPVTLAARSRDDVAPSCRKELVMRYRDWCARAPLPCHRIEAAGPLEAVIDRVRTVVQDVLGRRTESLLGGL